MKRKIDELCSDFEHVFDEEYYNCNSNYLFNNELYFNFKYLLEDTNKPKKLCFIKNCEHGRHKTLYKDCGTGYCDHGRQKLKCKDCGTGYCEHNRLKYRCKDCKRKKN